MSFQNLKFEKTMSFKLLKVNNDVNTTNDENILYIYNYNNYYYLYIVLNQRPKNT